MSRSFLAALAALGLSVLVGCHPRSEGTLHDGPEKPDYNRPIPEGQLALRRITDPSQIPDFTVAFGNTTYLHEAIQRSLNYLAKPSSRQFFPYGDVSHERAVASLQEFDRILLSDLTPEQKNQQIRERFDVYISVGWNGEGIVLFTGYYTPIFDASLVPTERFRYPLYRQPPDLQKDAEGNVIGQFPSRRELETGGRLRGLELVYLSDPMEVYVAHVQGSAKLRMPDGQLVTVGYAANNGHEYTSIGQKLIEDGQIPADELSLQTILAYFQAHPERREHYTQQNERFVFFTFAEGDPRGSLNEPVTPWRSIATDKAIYPRACLALLDTRLPYRQEGQVAVRPFRGFMLDQDTGGAIRAPGRCDVYMGVGDAAGDLAGRTKQEGYLYYVFLKQ